VNKKKPRAIWPGLFTFLSPFCCHPSPQAEDLLLALAAACFKLTAVSYSAYSSQFTPLPVLTDNGQLFPGPDLTIIV
jgi:hypothetical protein